MEKYNYVYRVDFLEVPHVYFGSRTSKRLPEEDIRYMGSPVTYKQYWIDYTPIKTILFTGFENREDAIACENELIRQQWNENISLSLNDHIGWTTFHRAGKSSWNKGKPPSAETRQKLSEALKGEKNHLYGKNRPEEFCLKMSELAKGRIQCTKTFVGVSPTGEQVVFANAAQFCRDRPELKLRSASIVACAKGHRPHHKGWRFFYYDEENTIALDLPPLKIGKAESYVGISPDGQCVQFTNCLQFVRDNPEWKFGFRLISACANGRQKSHRGWKFYYADDYYASLAS